MRKVIPDQMTIGEIDISNVEFDLNCRDEIPQLMLGLQYIYDTPEVRRQVFEVLKKIVSENISADNGRPGMHLWRILVLGTLRLNCNWDFDKLHDIANNHKTLRQILGHGLIDDDYYYALQTLKDNVSLFTPEVLKEINRIVVKAGHQLMGKSPDAKIQGKCDSFVVETNVHYPTDINLLLDAMRKVIMLIAQLCLSIQLSDWRQNGYNFIKIKSLFRNIQKLKRSTSKDETKQAKRNELIIQAHQAYINLSVAYLEKVEATLAKIPASESIEKQDKIQEIQRYMKHARRQIDQIERRVIAGEDIPHNEKVFSIFEEHTEWISKGKAGVPQELGLRVCVLTDNDGFILHHQVMEKQTDDKVAVPMIETTQADFPELNGCSFDKGFHSPANKQDLSERLDKLVLPKKGKLSAADKQVEFSEEFVHTRRKHSAIESAINALENHGLDRCPDHGIDGFKRYVALAVLARNIQMLGHLIQQKERKRRKRCERYRLTWERNRFRAAEAVA